MNNAWLQLLTQIAAAKEAPVVPPDVRDYEAEAKSRGRDYIEAGNPNLMNQSRVMLPGGVEFYQDNPSQYYEVDGRKIPYSQDQTIDATSPEAARRVPKTEMRVVPHVRAQGMNPLPPGRRRIRVQDGSYMDFPEDAAVNVNGQRMQNLPQDIDLNAWLQLINPARRK